MSLSSSGISKVNIQPKISSRAGAKQQTKAALNQLKHLSKPSESTRIAFYHS
jgi:hypothetical protein